MFLLGVPIPASVSIYAELLISAKFKEKIYQIFTFCNTWIYLFMHYREKSLRSQYIAVLLDIADTGAYIIPPSEKHISRCVITIFC